MLQFFVVFIFCLKTINYETSLPYHLYTYKYLKKSTLCKKILHLRGSKLRWQPLQIFNHFAVKTFFNNIYQYTLPELTNWHPSTTKDVKAHSGPRPWLRPSVLPHGRRDEGPSQNLTLIKDIIYQKIHVHFNNYFYLYCKLFCCLSCPTIY